MNIVSNALDYSAKNSDIRLIFQCDGVFLKLVRENEGIGFSPEALLKGKRLFIGLIVVGVRRIIWVWGYILLITLLVSIMDT